MHQIVLGDLSATLAELGGWLRNSLFLIAEAKEIFEDPRGRVLMHRHLAISATSPDVARKFRALHAEPPAAHFRSTPPGTPQLRPLWIRVEDLFVGYCRHKKGQ
jgi:hypothetical protein